MELSKSIYQLPLLVLPQPSSIAGHVGWREVCSILVPTVLEWSPSQIEIKSIQDKSGQYYTVLQYYTGVADA